MMVEMSLETLTEHQKGMLEELIRSYICDIVQAEDIEKLKEEGIIKNIDDIILLILINY